MTVQHPTVAPLWIKYGRIPHCYYTHGKNGVEVIRFRSETNEAGAYLCIDLRPEDVIAMARAFAPTLIDTHAAKTHLVREGYVIRKKRIGE